MLFEDNFCHVQVGQTSSSEVCCYVHTSLIAENVKRIMTDEGVLIGTFLCDDCN